MNPFRMAVLSTTLLLAHLSPVMAQTPRGGIKGGLNLSNFHIDDVEDENVRTGFHIAIYTLLMVALGFAIQPELNYSTKGVKAEYNVLGFQGENKLNLGYPDISVLATFKLGDDMDIHIGP
ncbi:PorT family protein [Fulvivirga sp. 29W222]|uniref:PorT family protein n=1 Tax=Fulvivirga marina TaxID=2494733 RepID=A0A937FX11_9BACT|nr:outer membrane beta-barrel protein [Fulvivirga marina]MBL6446593.1 PorT family protein [Fulvivirga marina]